MKVRSAIKTMCKHCYMVKRGKIRFVYCKKNPKHKQRQGFHTLIEREFDDLESLNVMPDEFETSLTAAMKGLSGLMINSPLISINNSNKISEMINKDMNLYNNTNGPLNYNMLMNNNVSKMQFSKTLGLGKLF